MQKAMFQLLTVRQAAERIGCSTKTIYAAIQAGRIAGMRQYDRLLVSSDDIDLYAAQLGVRNGYRKREQ